MQALLRMDPAPNTRLGGNDDGWKQYMNQFSNHVSESGLVGILAVVVVMFSIAVLIPNEHNRDCYSKTMVYGFTLLPLVLSVIFAVLTLYRAASDKNIAMAVYFLTFVVLAGLLFIYALDLAEIIRLE
jgi:hypothetical protein